MRNYCDRSQWVGTWIWKTKENEMRIDVPLSACRKTLGNDLEGKLIVGLPLWDVGAEETEIFTLYAICKEDSPETLARPVLGGKRRTLESLKVFLCDGNLCFLTVDSKDLVISLKE